MIHQSIFLYYENYGSCFAAEQFVDIQLGAKYTAKWGVQIAGMIFQTRSNIIMRKKEKEMEKPYWEGKEYSYFSHKKCEYFPCHKNADPDDFNCLFCYCPLYALGDKCGGNFQYTENGIKDCTNCMLPHKRKSYGYITGKYQELSTLMKKIRENEQTETKIPRGIK